MYFVGQQWQDTPWGTVEIVWLEELDSRRVKVEYSVNGETMGTGTIAHLDCRRCMAFPIQTPPHDNCKRKGQAGHSRYHCTASTCF
jgi:hypothetical protein